ncbi:hypothetical protein MLD38_022338 [Melastoma candidum]|uniref:Uncharacterized protein n=1 Tax=Melastoma candidum TaxID=119954 RepID=A0ACB9QIT3_9MYRT|nr:hypothetical protein MLD38_022338 [Melastoma candidum]
MESEDIRGVGGWFAEVDSLKVEADGDDVGPGCEMLKGSHVRAGLIGEPPRSGSAVAGSRESPPPEKCRRTWRTLGELDGAVGRAVELPSDVGVAAVGQWGRRRAGNGCCRLWAVEPTPINWGCRRLASVPWIIFWLIQEMPVVGKGHGHEGNERTVERTCWLIPPKRAAQKGSRRGIKLREKALAFALANSPSANSANSLEYFPDDMSGPLSPISMVPLGHHSMMRSTVGQAGKL